MNLEIYKYIAAELCKAIDKSYKKGIKSIAGKTKETLQFSLKYATNPLIDISYTDVDLAMLSNFKVEAFTVAGVMSYELEEKLKKLAIEIQSGEGLAKGEKDIKKIWVDEATNILADYIPVADMPPPSYLMTNLQTAINSSYHGSRWQRLQDPNIRNLYPAYQYKTRKDGRVRPEHVTLDDNIFQNEDPIWSRIIPPNGWNCRCYFTPLTTEEIQSSNSPVEPITDEDGIKRIIKEAGISKDFDRNSGESRSIWGKWIDTKFKDVNYYDKFKEVFNYSRNINNKQVQRLVQSVLDENKTEFIERELTEDNWKEDYPGDKVATPLGTGNFVGDKIHLDQIQKLLAKTDNRKKYYGAFKPTFNDPAIIIKDSEGGLIFVKAFTMSTKEIQIFGIGYNKGEIIDLVSVGRRDLRTLISKIKNGEVLHFSNSALNTFTEIPKKHFTFSSDLLNLNTKLRFSIEIKNIINPGVIDNEDLSIIENADEIWGETYNNNGSVYSELTLIKYSLSGIKAALINDNVAYKYKEYEYSQLNDLREGVMLL